MDKNKTIRYLLPVVVALTFGFSMVAAQDAVTAAGGNITGIGGSVSYTVGQVAYTTFTGTGGTVSQGVQQPFIITVVSGVEEALEMDLKCSVYPNPADEYVLLNIANYPADNLSYQLYTIDGQLLLNARITNTITTISLEKLTSATYMLKVVDLAKEIKVFKISKK